MIEQHVFYKTDFLSLKKRKSLIEDAKKLSYEWWVDILDCSVSFTRKKIEMSFNDIMAKFDKGCHFVVINRKQRVSEEKEYGEVGFSTMTNPDYFLWIYLSKKDLDKLISEYKLQIL